MRIYLDDVRNPNFTYPEGNPLYGKWAVVRNFTEFKLLLSEMIREGIFPEVISFDHDLGEDSLSGYEALKWLVDISLDENLPLVKKSGFKSSFRKSRRIRES